MSEQVTNKLAQLNVRPDKEPENHCTTNCSRLNGEDEVNKSNPWKPVSATENNALEAEAWPEPSAPGDHKRTLGGRQFDEKPKRKIKWQNYEVDHSPCGFSRGRGRPSGPAHFYGSPPAYTFRRGGSGFRGRLSLDPNRGRGNNGYLPRYPNRAPNIRPSIETREGHSERSTGSNACEQAYSVRQKSETANQENSATRLITEPDKKGAGCQRISNVGSGVVPGCIAVTTLVDTTQSEHSSEPQANRPVTTNQNTTTPKRSYRDRTFTAAPVQQSQSSFNGSTGTYEAGPVGRARRSYLRQHQPLVSSEQDPTSAQNSLVSGHSVQPVLPFHSLSPFTYLIPGTPAVSNTFWSTGIQLGSSFSSAAMGVPGNLPTVLGVNQPQLVSQSHTMTNIPHISAELPVSLLTDPSSMPQNLQSIHRSPDNLLSSDSSLKKAIGNSDIHVDVVDVNQMVSFITSAGWDKVTFPSSLKYHPTVAAALRTSSLADPTKEEPSDTVSSSVDGAVAHVNGEDSNSHRSSKPDDVVVVNNSVFFVPRNANRTKFLKFTSKSDYIRHHVEYYFSPSNLNRDTHLASILESNQGACPIGDLLQFNRLRWVGTSESELLTAISTSNLLAVNYSDDGHPAAIKHISEFSSDGAVSFQSEVTQPNRLGTTHSASHITQNGMDKRDASYPSNGSHSESSQVASSHATPHTTSLISDTRSTITHPVVATPMPHSLIPAPALLISPPARVESCMTSGQNPVNPVAQFYSPNEASGTLNSSLTQPAVYVQHPLSSQQATLLATAAAAAATSPHTGSLSASGVQSPDAITPFLPGLYRIASPGQSTFIPQLAGTPGFSLAPNSTVFFQFMPSIHAVQPGGYYTPGGVNLPPVLNRPVGSINPSGLLIPLAAGGGAQPVSSSSSPYHTVLTLPPGQVDLPAVSVGSGGPVLHPVGPPPAGTPNLATVSNMELVYSGHSDNKTDLPHQPSLRYAIPTFPYSASVCVSSGTNHLNVSSANEAKSNAIHTAVLKLPSHQPTLSSNEGVTSTGPQTRTSTHSTPNKLSVVMRP